MRKNLQTIMLWMISLLALTGCDVHEFPEESHIRVPFTLYLDFHTDLPLYKEIIYTRGVEEGNSDYDIRYIIHAYRTDNKRSETRQADTTFVFTKSDLSNLDYTAQLELREGSYDFKVWADYVKKGSRQDCFYDTQDFSEIILAGKQNYRGSNDYRDAFRGYATAKVANPAFYTGEAAEAIDNRATAKMVRPMGKFKFIASDVDAFMGSLGLHVPGRDASGGWEDPDSKAAYEQFLQNFQWGEYTVRFKYNIFMPCSFNMFTDKPADSWTGMSFVSNIQVERNHEICLGFDYAFVNGSETTLSISLELYDKEGELLSSTNPINVPIVRSKLTIVRGDFLTIKASGGVMINPGYDGEDFNIEIY